MVLLVATTSPYEMSWHDLPRIYRHFFDISYQYLELTKCLKRTKVDDLKEWSAPQNP